MVIREWQAIVKTGLRVTNIRENEVVYNPVRGQAQCQSAIRQLINKGEVELVHLSPFHKALLPAQEPGSLDLGQGSLWASSRVGHGWRS